MVVACGLWWPAAWNGATDPVRHAGDTLTSTVYAGVSGALERVYISVSV